MVSFNFEVCLQGSQDLTDLSLILYVDIKAQVDKSQIQNQWYAGLPTTNYIFSMKTIIIVFIFPPNTV